jgi:hypothetical protein
MRAVKGGKFAADELLSRVREYLRGIISDSDEMDVLVKAFANVEGLASALMREGKLRDVDQLRAFVTGFSSRLPFFDFVDIGAGKERAVHKIRGIDPRAEKNLLNCPSLLTCYCREREVLCQQFAVQAHRAWLLPRFRLRPVFSAVCRRQFSFRAHHSARGKPATTVNKGVGL